MKFSSRTIGLFQAAGLTLYVSFFAISVNLFERFLASQNISPNPILGIILFLLAFIISAIFSASIVFAYPTFLFIRDKRKEAVKTVLWNLAWLIFFFMAFLAIVFAVFASGFYAQ